MGRRSGKVIKTEIIIQTGTFVDDKNDVLNQLTTSITINKHEKHEREAKKIPQKQDWFMVGTIETLTQNIAKVSDQLDKNRILKRIEGLRNEERAKRVAAKKALLQEEANRKMKVQVWKYDYMVKKKRGEDENDDANKHIKQVSKCLGIDESEGTVLNQIRNSEFIMSNFFDEKITL